MTDAVLRFREERDWKQFHKPKDCAISLMLEAAEMAELFQWKTEEEMEAMKSNTKKEDLVVCANEAFDNSNALRYYFCE